MLKKLQSQNRSKKPKSDSDKIKPPIWAVFYYLLIYVICSYNKIMKLDSTGLLIGMRPFGERDCIAYIFTRDHGVMTGMLKAAQIAKKNKPLVGQFGNVSWNARVDSQLGAFHFESDKNLAAPLMMNQKLLGIINSAFSLVVTMLPERETYAPLFDQTLDLMRDLGRAETDPVDSYLNWEIHLLQELGYALDLSHCSNCGCSEHLHYLSPRTGRAVCDDCAIPYLSKLYKLPLTLDVTKKFLDKICQEQGIALPIARIMIH